MYFQRLDSLTQFKQLGSVSLLKHLPQNETQWKHILNEIDSFVEAQSQNFHKMEFLYDKMGFYHE